MCKSWVFQYLLTCWKLILIDGQLEGIQKQSKKINDNMQHGS